MHELKYGKSKIEANKFLF